MPQLTSSNIYDYNMSTPNRPDLRRSGQKHKAPSGALLLSKR